MSNPGATLAVELERATVRFTSERGSVVALENVALKVSPGGFVSLLGPSGCGKSTLLRLVADLVAPTHGTVTVLGGPPERARLNRELGFVFQDATLLPWRSALENVRRPRERAAARAVGRHAPARGDCPRARLGAAGPSHGRAVRRARRDHARYPQRGAA